ncbi:hypothetical protein Rhe02_05250 [Rhizocola hellebori]|uniref:TerD domain-containing protein n=1 Tax=Rhizocola hellebori TaxID=1392758 RepID=A0A8J3VDQ4_9ACTN|nr:TerD family protein [Rhizocola hellebori]GIH02458.1 hypothetical protein Rhe02_05250 [Rhizocola hellebori]
MDYVQLLDIAGQMRRQARVFTAQGDIALARKVLTDLIRRLSPQLAVGSLPASLAAEVAMALADAYGMLGGIEMRAGNLSEARQAYRSGQEIEQDPGYHIEDSYNLVNAIVAGLLIAPAGLTQMSTEIVAAAEVVRKQIASSRRDQWWAWADYGMLSVLIGDDEEAHNAYRQFRSCGPAISDYESVVRVLISLAEGLTSDAPEVVERLRHHAEVLEASAPGPLTGTRRHGVVTAPTAGYSVGGRVRIRLTWDVSASREGAIVHLAAFLVDGGGKVPASNPYYSVNHDNDRSKDGSTIRRGRQRHGFRASDETITITFGRVTTRVASIVICAYVPDGGYRFEDVRQAKATCYDLGPVQAAEEYEDSLDDILDDSGATVFAQYLLDAPTETAAMVLGAFSREDATRWVYRAIDHGARDLAAVGADHGVVFVRYTDD